MSTYGLTSNVLLRVRRIVIGNATGTAFTMEVDNCQYLVTAKHVVATMGTSGKVALSDKDEKPEEFEVDILRCDDPVDIAVLIPKKAITQAFALPASLDGAAIGQDMYFVGYPLGDYSLTTKTANERIGFVRRALFSAQQPVKGGVRIFLDGRNNKGFSGSPIVYIQGGKSPTEWQIAGVVSGYRNDITDIVELPVAQKKTIQPEDIAAGRVIEMSDGTYIKIVPTGRYVLDNSGIVIGYAIEAAVALIKASGKRGPIITQ